MNWYIHHTWVRCPPASRWDYRSHDNRWPFDFYISRSAGIARVIRPIPLSMFALQSEDFTSSRTIPPCDGMALRRVPICFRLCVSIVWCFPTPMFDHESRHWCPYQPPFIFVKWTIHEYCLHNHYKLAHVTGGILLFFRMCSYLSHRNDEIPDMYQRLILLHFTAIVLTKARALVWIEILCVRSKLLAQLGLFLVQYKPSRCSLDADDPCELIIILSELYLKIIVKRAISRC